MSSDSEDRFKSPDLESWMPTFRGFEIYMDRLARGEVVGEEKPTRFFAGLLNAAYARIKIQRSRITELFDRCEELDCEIEQLRKERDETAQLFAVEAARYEAMRARHGRILDGIDRVCAGECGVYIAPLLLRDGGGYVRVEVTSSEEAQHNEQ